MNKIIKTLKIKTPAILVGTGCAGIVFCAYSVFRETPKYLSYVEENPKMSKLERSRAILWHFWPSIAIGAGSAACFIGAHTIDIRRQAVLASALGISESALLEYKNAAEESLGENAVKKIEEKIAEKRTEEHPIPDEMVPQYEYRNGEVLFFEPTSGQHFWSTVETIRRAERECLKDCLGDMFVSVRDFFYEIDSPQLCRFSDDENIGWNAEHPIEVHYSVIEEKPGLLVYVLDYREPPTAEYASLHGPVGLL